jgi:hypothetical protein
MHSSGDTPHANVTLTEVDLAACCPRVGAGGQVLRAWCPFHGLRRQRSLHVQVHSGRFVCVICGAWGTVDAGGQRWRAELLRQSADRRSRLRQRRVPGHAPVIRKNFIFSRNRCCRPANSSQ